MFVGVPLNTPSLLILIPGGKVPDANDQRYGGVPPEAVSVAKYGVSNLAVGSEIVEILSGPGLIVSAKLLVADSPALSATRTLKLNAPAFVGVPLRTPPLLKVSPLGKAPESSDQV